jgi:hypothetical protein
MKYWGYLVAKIAVALAILAGLEHWISWIFPPLKPFSQGGPNPVHRDLMYTCSMLLFWLFAMGLGWLISWDQRYRCRTCLRRLRMPVLTGSWTHVLFGAPRTEYICPYGHGTLKIPELQITGHQPSDWQPNEDMWKELFSYKNNDDK